MTLPTTRIPVMPGTQLLRISHDPTDCTWTLWTMHNAAMTEGTFFKLYPSGAMERTTVYPDGHEETFIVKPHTE